VVQTAEPTSLDPISNTLSVTQNLLEGNVFEALVMRKDNMVLAPGLATAWRSVSPTTWEFDLRHGVKFQNGEAFDATSVVFTFQTILDPKNNNPFRPFLDVIASVTKVDDYTVRIETKQPYAPLVASLYPIMMLPPKAYQDMGSDAFGQHPIGTGPYDVTEWVKDDHITLRANPGYWNGAPAIPVVVFKAIPDDSTRVAALETGNADIIASAPFQEINNIQRRGDRALTTTNTRVYMIGMNTFKAPLNDVRVRQALNYAVDKQSLLRAFWDGQGQVLGSAVSPSSFGYTSSVKPYPYNPQKAKELLAEAGYPQGLAVSFDGLSGRYNNDKQIEEAIVGQLGQVGVRTQLNVMDFGTYWTNYWLTAKLNGLWFLGNGDPLFDSDYLLTGMLYSKGRGWYYSSPKTDALIERARTTMDVAARQKVYAELMQDLHDEAPWIFLFVGKDVYGVSSRIAWQPRPDGLFMMSEAALR